ncbi:MAG: Kelch repeat-containing protein [Planctomycetota bacterium]|jgi:N-acetylneuraminic acid mutarotase
MKKAISLILILSLSLVSVSLAAEGIWTSKADMPTARIYLSTSVVSGRIYAIGGGSRSEVGVSTVEEYDPTTDTWITKSHMPIPRWGFATGVVDGKIYVIGGAEGHPGSPLKTVEEYDPTTDTWTTKSPMPTARWGLSASVVNGKIYAIGGGIPSGYRAVQEYDPSNDTWTQKASIPIGSYGISTCAVNGKIYAIGGVVSYPTITSRVQEYNPVTDTWTTKADMLTARAYPSTSVVNGKIFAMGGEIKLNDPSVSIVEVYDTVHDTWTSETDMPTARSMHSASVLNGKIYVIGGSIKGYPYSALAMVEEYEPYPLIVDFNGDGAVDSADMCFLVNYWHTDEPAYDIAPRPFGDGIVDVQDLIFLAGHLFKELNDSTLVAHWALDESEGTIAQDSAGTNDAGTFGDPLWQPTDGQVDGAIQLDGIDDCVIVGSIPNPTEGPFSVLTWVKDGTPGQVVLSQIGGANWLLTDLSEGNLMTQLSNPGRSGGPMLSQVNITDGNWHRIGFVWDGLYRTLYVDSVAVAQDTQDGLEGLDSGLYIGTGNFMQPGTYWSGLIDDVRIYNRAVMP